MDATVDELAGVVDLFGGLTPEELERALSEAAFRADGASLDDDALAGAIDRAIDSFALVRYELDGGSAVSTDAEDDEPAVGDGVEPLLVAGPTAFPSVPAHAEDVPHILDVEPRRIDRDALGAQTREQFADAVGDAIEAGDDDRLRTLLDVSYDVEAWAPVEVAAERQRLEATLE